MGEPTMEEYMTRTREDNRSGIVRPKIDDKARFELKKWLTTLKKWHNGTSTRTRSIDTFDGLAAIQAQLNNLGREIKKVKAFEEAFYTQYGVPFSLGGRFRAAAPGERMKLDLEARFMGEALMINRSQDPSFEDFIELNNLNTPVELKRNQVEDLGPTIGEGEVIDEPMIDIIKTRNNESFDEYPSFCDFDRKIHIDCAYNLRFSCMIGFEHVNANFFPILSVNVISKKFYNSIMKVKVKYKGKNVVGAFMNVPIFVRNFSIVTHFVVVENMDGYRDQEMGDVMFGEPFCKASCVEARRFDGLITIHNGNDNVTYQMVRSHPSFKHLSNGQCNKIGPLLKALNLNLIRTSESESDAQMSRPV
ncbi:hypothetical protein Tco_1294740 [Tanacetum coccineum]